MSGDMKQAKKGRSKCKSKAGAPKTNVLSADYQPTYISSGTLRPAAQSEAEQELAKSPSEPYSVMRFAWPQGFEYRHRYGGARAVK